MEGRKKKDISSVHARPSFLPHINLELKPNKRIQKHEDWSFSVSTNTFAFVLHNILTQVELLPLLALNNVYIYDLNYEN